MAAAIILANQKIRRSQHVTEMERAIGGIRKLDMARRKEELEDGDTEGNEHTLAPDETHVFQEVHFEKLSGAGTWIIRRLCLTKDNIHLGRDAKLHNVSAVVDSIPLTEIVELVVDDLTASQSEGLTPGRLNSNSNNMGGWKGSRAQSQVTRGARRPSNEDAVTMTSVTQFTIKTKSDGVTSGKSYTFKSQDAPLCSEWVQACTSSYQAAQKADLRRRKYYHYRLMAQALYQSYAVQSLMVLLIFGNFVLNIIQAQMVPEAGSTTDRIFRIVDLILVIIFTLELLLNLFGNWLLPFLNDGWSMFDAVVVVASIIGVAAPDIPGLSVLRVARAFRALRLIGRFRELRRIINALAASIIPVLNSLFIGAVVNCVFSIVAVQFFAEKSEEKFGNFAVASYTLFIMATFDHPFDEDLPIYDPKTGQFDHGLVTFFAAYIIVVVWALLQVMVAVLLDNFITAAALERAAEHEASVQFLKLQAGPLDPLLQQLGLTFHTKADLESKIQRIFDRIDVDGSGSVDYQEIEQGLKKIVANMKLSREEYDSIIKDYEDQHEGMDLGEELEFAQFKDIMHRQLKIFIQKSLTNSTLTQEDEDNKSMMQGMKLLLLDQGIFGNGATAEAPDQNELHKKMDVLMEQLSSLSQNIQTEFTEVKGRLAAMEDQVTRSDRNNGAMNIRHDTTVNGDDHLAANQDTHTSLEAVLTSKPKVKDPQFETPQTSGGVTSRRPGYRDKLALEVQMMPPSESPENHAVREGIA